jgi:hypothetical protein
MKDEKDRLILSQKTVVFVRRAGWSVFELSLS